MDDFISRQDAIDLVKRINVKEVTPAYMLIDKAEIMTELIMLPSIKPDKTVIDNCLFNINSRISPHTSATAVIEIKHYIQELYEEIYGEGAKPKWMI